MLQEHWNDRVVNEVLERSHDFGAAMDIAHELVYLGFELHKDFDIGPVGVNAIPTPRDI